jgi:hypothetical protein
VSESLAKKLVEAQTELKAPKGNFNSFGKYKYRSAEDILEAVKPVNAKYGLLLTLSDEPIFIGDWHYIKATATISDGEKELSVTAYARESLQKKGMDDSQITGTASSYARKYALNGLYLIDDTKDADTDEYQKQSNQQGNDPINELNNQITSTFSQALQVIGSKEKLYEELKKTQEDMSKLYQSKNQKAKKDIIKQLEGLINDNRQVG